MIKPQQKPTQNTVYQHIKLVLLKTLDYLIIIWSCQEIKIGGELNIWA